VDKPLPSGLRLVDGEENRRVTGDDDGKPISPSTTNTCEPYVWQGVRTSRKTRQQLELGRRRDVLHARRHRMDKSTD
jgi:hypothetical protein